MAERTARVGGSGATRWLSLQIPELPDPAAARRASAALKASVRYLHNAHRLARHCERTDHLVEMRREAERDVEYQTDALQAVVRTMFAAMDLPEAVEQRGLEVASDELRKLGEAYER
jgi:hypothetical protein